MTHWKPKLAATVAVILLVAVPSTAAPDGKQSSLSPQDVLTRMQAAYAALFSYSDEVKAEGSGIDSEGKATSSRATATVRLSHPNLYRIEWHLEPASSPNPDANKTLLIWSQGDGAHATDDKGVPWHERDSLPLPFTITDMTFVPFAFFGQVGSGFPLSPQCCAGAKYVFGLDENVGDVDCYVLQRGEIPLGERITLWIGKKDYLLRQTRTVWRMNTSTQTHSNIVMNVPMSREDFGPSASN